MHEELAGSLSGSWSVTQKGLSRETCETPFPQAFYLRCTLKSSGEESRAIRSDLGPCSSEVIRAISWAFKIESLKED